MNITITEALAEIKTIEKRAAKKREFIGAYLVRQEKLKDPLHDEGGSVAAIARERQAIQDLEQRSVDLRLAINHANDETSVTIGSNTRSIAEWLIWRRDIAPSLKKFLADLQGGLRNVRDEAQRKGLAIVQGEASNPDDVIVNISEQSLAEEIENLENVLGTLDGQLSLKNATVFVKI